MNKLLCCPKCKALLQKKKDTLQCKKCKTQYAVEQGIPILIDLEKLPPHLGGQVKYFEKEDVTQSNVYRLDPWQKKYMERFLKHFPDVKNKVVIDCGTGSGYMAIELAKKGATVIACDLTLKSLVRLKAITRKKKLEKRMIFVCCTAETLPFTKQSADLFISNAVLEHLPKEKEAIEEINRVCKRKAGAMITVPLLYEHIFPLLLPLNKYHDKRIGHLRRYDEPIILRKFKNWKLIQSYYTGHVLKVIKTIINYVWPVFSLEQVEEEDAQKTAHKRWASNIITFIRR